MDGQMATFASDYMRAHVDDDGPTYMHIGFKAPHTPYYPDQEALDWVLTNYHVPGDRWEETQEIAPSSVSPRFPELYDETQADYGEQPFQVHVIHSLKLLTLLFEFLYQHYN